MKRTFEDFLAEVHAGIFTTVQDDDLPDHFDNWLGTLDGDEYIKWADLFAREQYLAGQDNVLSKVYCTKV
jgi:hypothetical protein